MLAKLVQAFTAIDATRAARRVRRAVITFAIAGLCLFLGVAFLIAAGFMLAVERFGAVHACLGFGAIFMGLAVAALAAHRILTARAARRRAQEAKATQIKTLAGATAMAVLPALLKGRGGVLQLALPLLAMAAYAIYKENAPDEGDDADR